MLESRAALVIPSVSDICKLTGLGRNTIYGQFSSVEEAVRLTIEDAVATFLAATMPASEANSHTPIDGVITFAERWVNAAAAAPQHACLACRMATRRVELHVDEALAALIARGVTAGAFASAPGVRARLLRAAVLAAAISVCAEDESAPTAARQLAQLIIAGCR
jgi:AcrR family transcriptional regulator